MTILPKKKPAKEKSEPENQTDHSVPHTSGNDPTRVARRTSSPPRWIQSSSRDTDRLPSHEPGGRRYQEEYGSHDGGANHNKRRHRSSPHRSIRKHRHDRPSCSGGTGRSTPPTGPRTSGPPSPASPPERPGGHPDMEEGMNTGYNSEDEYGEVKHPDNAEELERWFEKSLKKRGLIIKKMAEDGACLFRSVADQVYGDQEMHNVVRRSCVDYMAKNADFFKQYVTEEFTMYLNRKRMDSCHGNHVEMQALSELYNRPIEVYQDGTEPINTFHGAYKTDNDPIRISYHRNVHYNSVVDPYKATIGVGLGLPGMQPGLADKNQLCEAIRQSEDVHLEKTMLEDKMRETDWEVTQETMEEQVARESYLQWLRDNEKRATRQTSPRTASATCSSSRDSSTPWLEAGMSSESRLKGSSRNRSAANSAQNSPNRPDSGDTSSMSVDLQLPEMPSSPKPPTPGPSSGRCPTPEGAVGGVGFSGSSPPGQLPTSMYGISEWDEDDIIAQVIAQSQREYLESLKKTVAPSVSGPSDFPMTGMASTSESTASSSSSATCSSSSGSCSHHESTTVNS